jgi:hypothetical protein
MGRYLKNRELKSASYSIRVPIGNNLLAPNDPKVGQIRFNTSKDRLELYAQNRWRPFALVSDIEYPNKDTFYGTGYQKVFGPMRYRYPKGNEIFVQVFVFNVHQNPGAAYTIDDYNIIFSTPPPDNHPIVIFHGLFVGDALTAIPQSWQPPSHIYTTSSYRITGSSNQLVEHDANVMSFTVTTTNVENGTVLFYKLLPGDIPPTIAPTYGDFINGNVNYLYNGELTIFADRADFSIAISTDHILEYDESFYVQILTGNVDGTVVATSINYEIALYDPIPVSYNLRQDRYQVNEGDSVNFTLETVKVPDYTVMYYEVLSPPVFTANYQDFVGGSNVGPILSGIFTITSNVGTFTVTTAIDNITDMGEKFYVQVREGAVAGPIIATSELITISWIFF